MRSTSPRWSGLGSGGIRRSPARCVGSRTPARAAAGSSRRSRSTCFASWAVRSRRSSSALSSAARGLPRRDPHQARGEAGASDALGGRPAPPRPNAARHILSVASRSGNGFVRLCARPRRASVGDPRRPLGGGGQLHALLPRGALPERHRRGHRPRPSDRPASSFCSAESVDTVGPTELPKRDRRGKSRPTSRSTISVVRTSDVLAYGSLELPLGREHSRPRTLKRGPVRPFAIGRHDRREGAKTC